METLSQLKGGRLLGARRVDLSCGLKEFPREILNLADSLEVLNLSGNQLADLPDDFQRLAKLRILFCSENDFRHVPSVLGKCGNLEMIAFKSNRIETVPEDSLPPSVRWLILTDNRISKLPKSIGRCQPLQKLMLAGNRLESLPVELGSCENLELIRLAANRLEAFPEWLLRLPRLSWLAFAGNPMAAAPQAADSRVLEWSRLELLDQLGEGASGVIHGAKLQGEGGVEEDVAVKLFKGAMTSDGLPACEMAACLAAGEHRNLIQVLGKISDHPERQEGLVMKRISGEFANLADPPSLQSCTRDVYKQGFRLSNQVAIRIAVSIASVATSLHGRGILHGDLYAHNILWKSDGECLLGDFGAASFYSSLSPEFGKQLERVEVRAFGCLLEELLDRCASDISPQLRRLQMRCVSEDSEGRPSFAEILAELQTSKSEVTD